MTPEPSLSSPRQKAEALLYLLAFIACIPAANWMIGNFGTVVGPQVVVRLAGRDNWMAALYFSSAMFLVAALGWLFINPKRVIVYAPADHEKLREQGAI